MLLACAGRIRSTRDEDQCSAVKRAPQHEHPACAVPESAQYEGCHEVQVDPRRGATIAAERDIEVIAQVAAERHMPPAPEILDVQRLVGRIEIDRQPDVEQERSPDRHVTIAAEIEIELERVGEAGRPGAEKIKRVSPPSNPAFAQTAKVSAMTTFLNKPMLKMNSPSAILR